MIGRSVLGCVVVSALAIASVPTPPASAAGLPDGFQDRVILGGLTEPTGVRFAPDGRIFVSEKSGLIKVFENLADPTPSVFADLRTEVFNYWDNGLLGLELSADVDIAPYVYALYTYDAGIGGTAPRWGRPGRSSDTCPTPPGGIVDGCTASGRLSRFPAAGMTAGPEEVLLNEWCQQFPSHSIGSVLRAPDGAIYVSAGEGANFGGLDYGQLGGSEGSPVPRNPCGDPPTGVGGNQHPPKAEGGALRSQDLRTTDDPLGYSGTILRLDPETGAAMPGNPLAADGPRAARVVAYGLRNPFRLAVRPGAGELWIGDVGSLYADEIDVLPDPAAGPVRNYGWPCYEADARNPLYDDADLDLCESLYKAHTATAPYVRFERTEQVVVNEDCDRGGMALAGMAFYQGTSYPDRYAGALFFADHNRGCVWAMPAGPDGRPDPTRIEPIAQSVRPVELVNGPGGDIVYVDLETGTIHELVYSSASEERALSNLTPRLASNGLGPFERNQENGSSRPRDGEPLWINETHYASGLGTHAPADLRFNIAGCTRFQAIVGIDDSAPSHASVVFKVVADGKRLYRSPVMRRGSTARHIDVDLTGRKDLRLLAQPTSDGPSGDLADWADARLTCPATSGHALDFAPARLVEVGHGPHGVSVANMDGDAFPDLLVANADDNTVAVLLGSASGHFGPARTTHAGRRPKVAVPADLNHDGWIDVVTANQSSSSVGVLLGNGDGTLRPQVSYRACRGPHEVAVGRFNADGHPDLAVACFGGTTISVLLGNGDGTFRPRRQLESGGAPHSVVVADFNGDEEADLAVANHGSATVSVLLGRGDGSFRAARHYRVGEGPHSVRTADLDGDGLLDLVTANDASGDVSVLLGRTGGTFAAAVSFAAGRVPKSVGIADLDDDGDLDIVAALTAGNFEGNAGKPGGDLVAILPGDGHGSFGLPRTFYVGPAPFSIAFGDFDGDGRRDLVTADFGGTEIAVLLNRAGP
jgi:glucose/arabinose dehydrogenase